MNVAHSWVYAFGDVTLIEETLPLHAISGHGRGWCFLVAFESHPCRSIGHYTGSCGVYSVAHLGPKPGGPKPGGAPGGGPPGKPAGGG
jgi:hypothetical protein